MKTPIPQCFRRSLALAGPLLWLSAAFPAQAEVKIAGQMLIDLNYTRGITTAVVDTQTRVVSWTNYGALGGSFVQPADSAYATAWTAGGGANMIPPFFTPDKGAPGINVPESNGGRSLVASFTTPPELQGSNPYSIEVWLWKNNTATDQRGVFAWTENFPAVGDAGKLCAGDPVALHNNGKDLAWGTLPTSGAWHHVTLTYDGITEKIYLDGVLQNSAAKTLNITTGTYYPMIFSGLVAVPPTNTSFSLNAAIGAVRVHSDALSAADVVNNNAAGISAVPVMNVSVQPLAATNVTATSASLNGNLAATTSPSTTAITFYYGPSDLGKTTSGWPGSVTLAAPNNTGTFSSPVTGLTANSTYFVRIHAVNANGEAWSSPTTFQTPGMPVLASLPAALGAPGNATVSATLNPNGYATTVKVYWGTTDGGTTPTSWGTNLDLGAQNAGTVSTNLTDLDPANVTYFYTFSATNQAGTTWATPSRSFKTRNIPATSDLLFSAMTDSFAPTSGQSTGNWASFLPAGQTFTTMGNPKIKSLGGVKWVKNLRATEDGYRVFNYDGNPITTAGVTIVAAISPLVDPSISGEPRGQIVDLFYDRLGFAISHTDGRIMVARNYWNDWGPAIPNGQRTILSLVVQVDGSYKVYANGSEVMSGGANGNFSTLTPPDTWKSWAAIGRNQWDGWSAYNGLLGDIFVYKKALGDTDRQALEADLTAKFITDANLSYTITATPGANGSISPEGAVPVIQGESQTFTFAGDSGYVIGDVLVDGVSVGPVLSYTFNEVSAPHTISASFVSLPPQTITASAGANGSISPSGAVMVDAGTDQTFTVTPNSGYKIADVLVDGNSVGAPASYTFPFVVASHTIQVTFAALSLNIPRSGDLLVSVVTDDLPADGAAITSWPSYVPTGTLTPIASPTVEVINGIKWQKNSYLDNDGFRFGGAYANPIPCAGATIVAVVRPTRNTDTWWSSVVNIFYNKLMLNVRNNDGVVQVVRNGIWYDGPAIPTDSPAVLSAVVQPTGEVKLYINGIEAMSKTELTNFTQLVPGSNGFEKYVNLGRNDPDGWTTYNGNIGDVFVYKTALTDGERQQLEGILMPRYGIVFHTIAASAGANGTITPSGDVQVVAGTNPTFSFTPAYGFAVGDVRVDGASVGAVPAYTFDNVTANHTIAVSFVSADNYLDWISNFFFVDQPEAAKSADPDNDAQNNLVEFALDSDPTSGKATGKIRSRFEEDGGQALMLTIPVINDAIFTGDVGKTATIGTVRYIVEGTNDMATYDQAVNEVIPARAADMEPLSFGWSYRTFRLTGIVPTRGSKGFLRVRVEPVVVAP